MPNKLLLNLVAMPTVVGSLLTMALMAGSSSPAQAAVKAPVASCDVPANLQSQSATGVLVASSIPVPGEYPSLDFTEAESDAAVTLFGCDCSSCIQALQNLRSQSLSETVLNNQGHCWTSMQQRVSPQQLRNVLQNLDLELSKPE